MKRKLCLTPWLLSTVLCAQTLGPKEACSIEGSAVDASTGQNVRNANVFLQPVTGTAQSATRSHATATDVKGRFEIQGIFPGSCRLTARRAGFLQVEYGARGPGKPGTPLVLAAGQSMTAVALRITRGGVITGRVLEELCDPVDNGLVSARRYQYVSGERQLTTDRTTNTDDQGNHRLYGLDPGRYFLRVSYTPAVPLTASRAGILSDLAYVPVYYPGTTDQSAASQIELAAGSQLSGVDFPLVRGWSYRVIGEVQGTEGVSGRFITMIRPGQGPVMSGSSRTVTLPQKATRIDMQGITPGSYVPMAGTTEQGRPFIGSVDLEVVDRDVTNLCGPPPNGSRDRRDCAGRRLAQS